MPGRRDRWGRCEMCGRRILHGKVCRHCEDRIARRLAQARGLVNRALVGIGFRGTVRQLRTQALPEIRQAGIGRRTLASAAVRLQARLDAIMARTGVAA